MITIIGDQVIKTEKEIKCLKCGANEANLEGPIFAEEGHLQCKYIRCVICSEHYFEPGKLINTGKGKRADELATFLAEYIKPRS